MRETHHLLSAHGFPFVFHARTPKAFDNTAQGREAHPGLAGNEPPKPNGVVPGPSVDRPVCNPFGVDARRPNRGLAGRTAYGVCLLRRPAVNGRVRPSNRWGWFTVLSIAPPSATLPRKGRARVSSGDTPVQPAENAP